MSSGDRIKSSSFSLLAVLTSRVVGGVLLAGLYLFVEPPLPTERPSVTVGLLFWVGSSLLFGLITAASRRTTLQTAYAVIVVGDCVTFGLFTAVYGAPLYDPFYVWYLAEAVFVATIYRTRETWALAALLALSYLISREVATPLGTAPEVLLRMIDTGVLLGAPWLIAFTRGLQERRGAHLEAQQSDMIALNQRLERSVSELSALTEFTDVIHSTLDVESVGPVLLDIVQRITEIPAACLYVLDKKKQETIFAASKGMPPVWADDLNELRAGRVEPVTDAEVTFACIDVVEHSDMLVVFCADSEIIETLSENNRIVLQAIASQLVVAVENSRLYRLTKRLAITDELTDLHNYRYLQQRLDEEIGRAKRYDKRLSFLMLDMDNFKAINDLYGHLVGDLVLGEIGQVLQSTVREVDIVARYGGEEFSVVLPETDASGAFIVAEKIREAVSLHRFPDSDGGRRIHATVSIGLASFPTHAHDKESLLRAADDALYHAKAAGKDRVRAPRLRLRRTQSERAPMEGVAE